MNNPAGVVTGELAQAKLLRAIYSERQLEEVMTDFWFNHFNVFVDKGTRPPDGDQLRARCDSPARARQVRGPAGGNGEESGDVVLSGQLAERGTGLGAGSGNSGDILIGAYASPSCRGQIRASATSGLNENYGRELLELHTLSVNGGYSQRDVTEVAKVFTGWTIDKPGRRRRLQVRSAHARAWAEVCARTSHQAQGRRRGHWKCCTGWPQVRRRRTLFR